MPNQKFISPFDAIYTLLYLISILSLGYMSYVYASNDLTQENLIGLFFTGLAMMQYLRMYHYLHSFDNLESNNDDHFVKYFDGYKRFFDRILRFFLAGLIILTSKTSIEVISEDKADTTTTVISLNILQPFFQKIAEWVSSDGGALVNILLPRTNSGNPSVDMLSLIGSSMVAMAVCFLLLILWDINAIVSFKSNETNLSNEVKQSFYDFMYVNNSSSIGVLSYFSQPKFWERALGFFTFLLFLLSTKIGPVGLVAASIFGIFFVLLWLKSKDKYKSIFSLFTTLWEYFELTKVLSIIKGLYISIKNKMKSHVTKIIIISLIILALLGLIVLGWSCYSNYKSTNNLTPVSLATSKNVWSSLPLLADHLKYFKDEGLDVNVTYGKAGRYNMDALVSGSVDFATIVEVNLAYMGYTGNKDFLIISSVVTSKSLAIVGRRSAGINKISDLINKSIAYSPATGGELYAFTFLSKNEIPVELVDLRKIQPTGLQTAIIAGEIDAASTWEPFVYNISNALGDDAIVFRDPSAYTGYMNLAVRPSWAEKNKETVAAFLKALKRAEQYANENVVEAQSILANIMSVDVKVVKSIWPFFEVALSLDVENQIAITTAVAKSIKNNQESFSKKDVPDYSTYFSKQYLNSFSDRK